MSDLIAIAYPDQGTAFQMRDTLARLQRDRLIELADPVVVKGPWMEGNLPSVRLDPTPLLDRNPIRQLYEAKMSFGVAT